MFDFYSMSLGKYFNVMQVQGNSFQKKIALLFGASHVVEVTAALIYITDKMLHDNKLENGCVILSFNLCL